ncbi:histone-lysine N-methyltransferase SETDB2 [Carettochelys insculpta]|uniref:histone-lysine N-methyltransferase SETDB2 n=1 Tax=Carettochelys insculpta TaxID=44489 RepID=UPI003EBBAB8C
MRLLQRMEEEKPVYTAPVTVTSECLDVEPHSSISGEGGEGDAQMFWRQMEDETVDFIFEQAQNMLLSLKQKIKDGTATNDECFQALMLVNRGDVSNLLALTNVNNLTTEGGKQRLKPRLQRSIADESTTGFSLAEWGKLQPVSCVWPVTCFNLALEQPLGSEVCGLPYSTWLPEAVACPLSGQLLCVEVAGGSVHLPATVQICVVILNRRMEVKEKSHLGNEDSCSETRELPLKLCYQNHDCSNLCLASRPLTSFKGENPLKIPILCHFQRRHAKADSFSKSLDVNYKAPCGRTLRNYQDVQHYLCQTECNFLFVDHFSFNTYVQLCRNTLNREALVFDFDISNGAESVPVSFCNEANHARLPYFKYRKATWPRGYFLNNFSSMFLDSCDCTDGCTDRSKCACLQLTANGCSENSASPSNRTPYGYRYKRLDGPVPSGIYECNLSCKCDRIRCQNRVAQHGIQVRLQVFNTERKGWGVRCLDDIDKGTFVCTYSGRIMSRVDPQEMEAIDHKDEKKNVVNEKSPTSLSLKRKLDTAYSDSEIELVQTGKDNINRKCESLSQPADDKYKPVVVQNYGYNPTTLRSPASRPKTRTAILQARRLKLEVAAVVRDASLDEDDSSLSQQSTKIKLTPGTKKGEEKPNLQQKPGEPEKAMQTVPCVPDSAKSEEKRPLAQDARCGKSAGVDDAHVARQSVGLPQRDAFKEETNRRSKQDAIYNKEAEGDNTSLKKSKEENIYLLDATKEGNVGRFLNHSCCPNLFLQSVFVETHNRNFPWVAFFTNRHVKAGTELTWDYGYEAGSMPETEISYLHEMTLCKLLLILPVKWRHFAGVVEYILRGTSSEDKETTEKDSERAYSRELQRLDTPLSHCPLASTWKRHRTSQFQTDYTGQDRIELIAKGEGKREHLEHHTSWELAVAEDLSVGDLHDNRRNDLENLLQLPDKKKEDNVGGQKRMMSLSPGDSQIMEKMVKRKCAFCPADEECAIMYIAEKQNLAVHQDCLLYSSGFVESEEHNPENQDTRFDVASVQSEIRRGKRLMCNFCRKKGATVGCEIKNCRRSYHYFCALCDDAALETDGGQGIYRVFCPNHDPGKRTNHYDADSKRNRHGMKSSTFTEKMSTEETAAENSLRLLRKKHNKHKARIDYLRKCKQAGLLDGIFKEMLDTLHLAKAKLMDDNTSETEYEETVISLFDCSLFENILTNVHSGTEEKLQELLEKRKRLDTQIELLQDLKEIIPFQENIASASSSVSE